MPTMSELQVRCPHAVGAEASDAHHHGAQMEQPRSTQGSVYARTMRNYRLAHGSDWESCRGNNAGLLL
jgi:hypothetical protein